jgi:hypothetical protein
LLKTATVSLNYSDETGLIFHRKDGSVEVRRPEGSPAVRSEANLIIIMRDSGDKSGSLVINQFKLAVGQKDE